ncbi:MAG: hypothetical protein WDO70_02455 [Alphaproteobacteria bacterium]
MMRIAAAIICAWALCPLHAQAAEPAKKEGAQTVTISRAACRALIKHHPSADVAYQPGVDVNGKKVAPADLEDTPPIELPETIAIELDSGLRQWLPNQDYPYNKLDASKVRLGAIEVTGDQVTYNGQPLTSQAQENLAVLCLEQKP